MKQSISPERSKAMFRKTRIRKRILVVGLGLAALAAPTTALAGGYSGQGLKALIATSQAENNRYGGHDGYSFQALQAIDAKGQAMNQRYGGQDGLSAQAYNALVVKGEAMNQRYGVSQYGAPDGWTPYVEQLTRDSKNGPLFDGRSPDTKDASYAVQQEILDGRSQSIATLEQGIQLSRSEQVADGRSPDTRDSAVVAHEPVVTVTKTPGFQWGDFGIGTGVALAAVILLALSLRFLSNRQDRKPGSVATA
jgi:hypothetical protein